MKRIIIGDLCGGSQNSVYNALKLLNRKDIEIYTFDIVTPTRDNQIVIDLTLPNVIEQLKQGPKPDIIFSSPLCQTFSLLCNVGKNERLSWKLNKYGWYEERERESMEEIIKNNKFLGHFNIDTTIKRTKIGKTLLDNVLKIIEYFNPKAYYIENPKTSLMWEYIKKNYLYINNYYLNSCEYSSYDITFSKKPTIFMSNLKLDLKRYGIVKNVKRGKSDRLPGSSNNETGERVRIPYLLIIDIFKQMEKQLGK